MKFLIAGGPRTGKTTLAIRLGEERNIPVLHGDDLIGKLDWSQSSEEILKWFDRPESYVIEGVQIGRALRKWMDRNPTGKPADKIYFSFNPWITLTSGQAAMNKGCQTVWLEVAPELLRRGVNLERIKHHESGMCIA